MIEEGDPFKRLVDMSQSNTSSSLKSIQTDQESPPTSKTDNTDRGRPKAEKPKQKDVVPNKPKNSQPNANAETAATKGSASKLSITERLERLDGLNTNRAWKHTTRPCGPCECWSLDCDGEHPMCNNCEYYGRRCSYD